MIKFFVIIFFSFILSACSNKQLYHAGQDYQKSVCTEKARSAQQIDDCLKTNKKSYEDYQKDRKTSEKK
ncbi:MAG TPA: hypothetical protein ENJ60_03060 [Aeromonadales bacterium]|nr:hypothetical protein [Aeromonadales bacterium]